MLLAAVFISAVIVIMHAGRDTTFAMDDWTWVQGRISWRPHIFLYPHNEHLSALPIFVYKVLFETVGLAHYWVWRLVAVAFDLTCAGLLFVFVRRRLGPWLALGLAANLVFTGTGAIDIVWPFQIGFLGSLATGIGALLLLDDDTRRSDIGACVLLCLCLSSSSQGLVITAAVLLNTLLRPRLRERFWVPLIPIVLYIAWYVKYGRSTLELGAGIPQIPNHVFHGLSVGTTAATGLPTEYGGVLAAGLIAAVLYSVTRAGVRLPALLTAVALPLIFWVIVSLARTGVAPDEPRYIYPTSFFVIVMAAEALLPLVPPNPVPIMLAAILGLGALGGAAGLNPFGDVLRQQANDMRANLSAAELLHDRLPPDYTAYADYVHMGEYDRAAAAYGSTIHWSAAQIPKRSASERAGVDAALVRIGYPAPKPTSDKPPAGCSAQAGNGKDATIRLPGAQLYIQPGAAPVEIRLRRFGDTFPKDAQFQVAPGSAQTMTIPSDRSRQPWIVALRSQAGFKACPR